MVMKLCWGVGDISVIAAVWSVLKSVGSYLDTVLCRCGVGSILSALALLILGCLWATRGV